MRPVSRWADVAQYFGWQWPSSSSRFGPPASTPCSCLSTIVAVGVLLTTVDPIMLTEYSIVFSAMALPLTYFPILVVANDRTYMGEHVNGRLANTLGTVYLFVVGWPPPQRSR